MDLGLTGDRALVLAGTRGLGLAAARTLAAEGVTVALVGRGPDAGKAAVANLGAGTAFFQGDLSDSACRAGLPVRTQATISAMNWPGTALTAA